MQKQNIFLAAVLMLVMSWLIFGVSSVSAAVACGTGGSGICTSLIACSTGIYESDSACTGGTVCCLPASNGGQTACTGTCRSSCQANESSDSSQTCQGSGSVCCKTNGTGGPPGGTGSQCTGNKIGGVCFPSGTGLSEKSIVEILTSFISWILGIFGFIAILGFIISGVQYILATGDEGMAETAKRNMKYSIIGIIVALSGWVIIKAIDTFLSASPFI